MDWSVENSSEPVCVVTTAWNHVDVTLACLKSVFNQDYDDFSVILVDNASQDQTAERVSIEYPQVEVLLAPHNLGFAGGFNLGLSKAIDAGFQYILLINNDTILAPNCMSSLVQAADIRPKAGLLTAKIYYAAEEDRIWSVGGRIHTWNLEIINKGDDEIDTGQWDSPRLIDFAPLCGVLLRGDLLKKIGYLDEGFFLYYEDMDFCLRARSAGFELWFVPEANILHEVSTSSGGRYSPVERYWMAQSSGRYFRKHGRGWRMLIILPYRAGSAAKMMLSLLSKGQFRSAAAYIYGLLIGWTRRQATKAPPSWVTTD